MLALVGVDGAGKSTQALQLEQRLRVGGAHVVRIHPFGRKLLTRALAAHASPALPRGGPPTRGAAHSLLALADAAELGAYLWLVTARCGLASLGLGREIVIVSDRSFDDTVLRHSEQGALSPRLLAALRRYVPSAERTVLLALPPGVAARRDGEHDRFHYASLGHAYERAASERGWFTVDGDRPVAIVADDVERLLR
jgi:thymidylate kinase